MDNINFKLIEKDESDEKEFTYIYDNIEKFLSKEREENSSSISIKF
jgi:hypothetical protein